MCWRGRAGWWLILRRRPVGPSAATSLKSWRPPASPAFRYWLGLTWNGGVRRPGCAGHVGRRWSRRRRSAHQAAWRCCAAVANRIGRRFAKAGLGAQSASGEATMDLQLTADEHAFPGRGARLRARQPARLDPRKERRRRHLSKDDYVRWTRILAAKGWAAPALAEGMGRHRLEPGQAGDLSRRDSARQRARGDRLRRQHGRPGHLYLRLPGAEGTVPAAHRRSPGLVVSGLFRARRGIRPREPADERPARRRCVGDLRPEDLDTWPSTPTGFSSSPAPIREAKKQEGISFFLVDMKTPGITVRPIQTIDGGHEVNEVFFDDVRVPARRNLSARRTRAGTTPNSCSPTNATASRASAFRRRGSTGCAQLAAHPGLWPGAEDRRSVLPRQARGGRGRAEGAGNDPDARDLQPPQRRPA